MVLALQWLPGYCAVNACSFDQTKIPSNRWTIHGLWPDTCSGAQVATCDSARQYTDVYTRLQGSSIFNDMTTYYLSYNGLTASGYNSFWSHEWGKHGTCYSPAATSCVSGTNGDVIKFFGDVITAAAKFDLYAPLYNAGIVPGGTYTATAIKTAIQNAFPGIAVGLQCTSGTITEIWIDVLGVGGGAVAKAASFGSSGTCGSTVKYPAGPNNGTPTSTLTGTPTPTDTPTPGSCTNGHSKCVHADGSSGVYEYCASSVWHLSNCSQGSSSPGYPDLDYAHQTGTLCYQTLANYAGCE
ncbi:ribonuclease T2-like [Irineochytrium annulatum]|nr:ribonuclease T2-like [Irineochytrium annulatum]